MFLEGVRTWALGRLKSKKEMLVGLGLPATFYPRAPRNVLRLNTLTMSRFLAPALAAGPVVVHARGLQGAHCLLPLRRRHPNLRILCDVRGIEWAEYELDIVHRKGRSLTVAEKWWMRSLSRIEHEAVRGSDGVLCVSRSMIPYLSGVSGVSTDKFSYVPCAVDVEKFQAAQARRDEVRRALGVGDRPVLVYAGSLSAWQIPETLIDVAARAIQLRPDAVFLGITTEPESLAALARRAGIPDANVICRRVPHADVAAHLSAGDISLLLREDNVVNRYACPTKFAEYLACGLHVLATPSVNEAAETIRETGAGTLLPTLAAGEARDAALREALSRAADANRVARSVAAAGRYAWARHLPTLKKWYRELASGSRR